MMQVGVHSPKGSPTFDFNRARIAPSLTAPSSPTRFGSDYYDYYLSAPSSPSRFDYYSSASTTTTTTTTNADDGFAFFVNGQTDKSSRSAEELFDGGKIKPLKEESLSESESESAKSPLLPGPRPKSPSRMAQEERRGRDRNNNNNNNNNNNAFSNNSGRRVTRSLSPYRVSDYTWDEEAAAAAGSKEVPNPTATISSSKSSRKWRFRDLLLFRSASEGRGSSKDPLMKLYKKAEEGKAPSAPRVRRKDSISAHELHYARKKAESEDLKKKTFLPYKQGILGRLAGFGR